MRNASVVLRIHGVDPRAVFERVHDFARYPDFTDVVRSVTVHEISREEEASDWEVYFRNGILRWTEADRFDREALVISFEQVDGDFEEFSGSWRITADGPDSLVSFSADFDFGIPSLAGILDPVAQRVFKETIARVVFGLFAGAVSVVDDEAVARAVAESAIPSASVAGPR
ncbi:SRPBCC family protein [Streptomyces somaliensis]|uniref:type II toxin-antitoxin system RatA family toxin n=1 Tax=Streptomyces somaliensis TaxID=78355 RepID=UPI0020CCADFE|nr:SRPBCC family protein [Streptomyces somaliensis]MCP9944756.1 SRPBCC family protein [Streptomyces somaliensis]MCP9962017.1 SRPBCC family protein [Streptomyces somaliensis]MCP9974837.1 SRPBCC family protein [Streptomyces somaliensis]